MYTLMCLYICASWRGRYAASRNSSCRRKAPFAVSYGRLQGQLQQVYYGPVRIPWSGKCFCFFLALLISFCQGCRTPPTQKRYHVTRSPEGLHVTWDMLPSSSLMSLGSFSSHASFYSIHDPMSRLSLNTASHESFYCHIKRHE